MGLIRPLHTISFRGAYVARAAVPALPGPLSRCPRFQGHLFIHGSAVATVAVPKVTVPGPRVAMAGARLETGPSRESRECPGRSHSE